MKIFKNKKSVQKIIIALIISILFNFIFPIHSRAEWWGGGPLYGAISDLVCAIGDTFIIVLQKHMMPGSPQAVDHKSPAEIESSYGAGNEVQNINNGIRNIPILGDLIGGAQDWLAEGLNSIGLQNDMKDKNEKRLIPAILYSPATIFLNLVPALDVNFINPSVTYFGGTIKCTTSVDRDNNWVINAEFIPNTAETDITKNSNTAGQLRETIATWYVALRNIAIVGLLSVLVYTGIRMILSSTAGEIAKYKMMLKDWLVAMCILFFMHYMMAFMLKVSEKITDLFMMDSLTGGYSPSAVDTNNSINYNRFEHLNCDVFMSICRTYAESDATKSGEYKLAYAIMYMVLVFYTIIFTWKYLKRFIYLAFLTIISPLVALTYPIDKMRDGSAQAYNKWFTEYLYNILLQPIHLILYTILITSAKSFAEKNIIYSVVAIGFMLEADKIVRDLFKIQPQKGEPEGAIKGGAIFGATAGLVQRGLGLLPGGAGNSKSGGKLDSPDKGKVSLSDRLADKEASKPLDAFAEDKDGNSAPQIEEPDIHDNSPDSTSFPDSSSEDNSGSEPSDSNLQNDPGYKTDFFKNRYEKALQRKREKEQQERDKQLRKQIHKSVKNDEKLDRKKKRQDKINGIKSSLGNKRAIKGFKKFGKGLGDGARFVGNNAIRLKNSKAGKKVGSALGKVGKIGVGTITGAGTVIGRWINRNGGARKMIGKYAGKGIKLAAQGMGAATLGAVGLAAGLASDDASDIIKYTSMGVVSGAAIGGNLQGIGGSILSSGKGRLDNIEKDFREGYNGQDYQKYLNKQSDKAYLKDPNEIRHLKYQYGNDWKEKQKQALKLRAEGIIDRKDIDRGISLMDKYGTDHKEAANIVKFVKDNDIASADLRDAKKYETIKNDVLSRLNGNEKQSKRVMQFINAYKGFDINWDPTRNERPARQQPRGNQGS